MIAGTWLFYANGNKPTAVVPLLKVPMYTAFTVLILNLVLAIILTPVFELIGAKRGKDNTQPSDYEEELIAVGPAETGLEALG